MSILHKKCLIVLFCFSMFSAMLQAEYKNLVLNKKLKYEPAPSYALTMHEQDTSILTNGKTEGNWYTPKSTVGWRNSDLIEIEIDLGEVYSVDFINVHTFCGPNNGIEFPEYIAASGSLDGRRYRFISFVATDGWKFSNPVSISRIIRLPVEQKVRYIKLYVRPFSVFFFSTEIEVFESQDAVLTSNSASAKYLSKEQIISLVERARQLQRDSGELETRIGDLVEKDNPLINDWQEVAKLISSLRTILSEETVAEAESRFASCRAKWFSLKYKAPWLCYRAEPMDVLHHGYLPADVPENFEISLYQWQNEYGAAAINLVNCSDAAIYFSANFSPLYSDGNAIGSQDIFQLRRGVYIWVPQAGLVIDPLVLQNSKPFSLAPGQTVQVWIDIHSKGLKQGIYVAALSIEALGENLSKERQIVPMKIEVAGSKFPEKLPFSTYNWDYVTRNDRFTKISPKAAVKDLAEHYINVMPITVDQIFVNNAWSIGKDKFSPEKFGLELKSMEAIGISEGRNKPFFLFATGGLTGTEMRFGDYGTPGFANKYKDFLRQLVGFMLSKGYSYDSFAIYPFDESLGWEYIYVARIIREFNPNIKIYANRWLGMDKVDVNGKLKIVSLDKHFEMIKGMVDIWCPHIQGHILHNPTNRNRGWYDDNLKSFSKYRDTLVGEGKQVWGYHANIARELFYFPEKIASSKDWRGSNRKAFRTMPIVAASLGMTGMGFWVYTDSGSSGWERYVTNKDGVVLSQYGVVYDGSKNPDKDSIPEFIVPSKRWQQWRLGVQDAVCLMEHKVLLEEFFKKSDSLDLNDEITSEYLMSLRRRADAN